LLLLESAFFDFVAAEGFEVVGLGEGREGEEVDEPFGGVVLVPYDCVAWVCVSCGIYVEECRRTYGSRWGIRGGSCGSLRPW
jgi:hypothetical protein